MDFVPCGQLMVVSFVEPVLFSCHFNGLGPCAVFDFATQYVGTNDQTMALRKTKLFAYIRISYISRVSHVA